VHFYLKLFFVSFLCCFIYQLLLLFTSNVVAFFVVASVLVIACLVFVYMSSSCFLRG